MRIIAGIAGGRRLKSPKSTLIRPVSDKVKEAIFSILGSVENERVLDLFAGTGSVGLEALSRKALEATFVDSGAEAVKLLRQNVGLCGFEKNTRIVRGFLPDILERIARKTKSFDLVFVDPPYDRGLIDPVLKALLDHKLIDAQSRVIIEHSPREVPECEGLILTDQRKYGQTYVSFLRSAPLGT